MVTSFIPKDPASASSPLPPLQPELPPVSYTLSLPLLLFLLSNLQSAASISLHNHLLKAPNFSHAQHPPPYPTSASPLAQSCLCCSDAQPSPTLANHCIKPHASSPSCFTNHVATASTTRLRGLTRSH